MLGFVLAFLLAIGCISLILESETIIENTHSSFFNTLNAVAWLGSFGIFLGGFFLLGYIQKIPVKKSIFIIMLIGVLFGTLANFAYNVILGFESLTINEVLDVLTFSITYMFFFSIHAIVGLLLAELKWKRSSSTIQN